MGVGEGGGGETLGKMNQDSPPFPPPPPLPRAYKQFINNPSTLYRLNPKHADNAKQIILDYTQCISVCLYAYALWSLEVIAN